VQARVCVSVSVGGGRVGVGVKGVSGGDI
jgi:hypothetical protein